MTIKDCLYRELKYGLCGSGGALDGVVEQDHIALDARLTPDSQADEDDYPWLIFRRVTSSEDNQVRYARERIEFEVIGLRSSPTKGDDLLETVRLALMNHFAGKRKTWGKFEENGDADADGGLLLKAFYMDTVEDFTDDLREKSHILIFIFNHVRS